MKHIWYKTGFKTVSVVLQGICAAVLVLCYLNLSYWMEGNFRVSEMGKSFEETELFLKHVEDTVRAKISYQQNLELFELNGQFDEMQQVDIRQYASGTRDELALNLNTTYYIRDLLDFHENGEEKMRSRIQKLIGSGIPEDGMGESLIEETQSLETILPISGSSLADYAQMSKNPASALLEYYQNLCETSQDVARRYQEYLETQDSREGEKKSEAPSNVRYYVENTVTKERYTNLGVKSFGAARRMIQNDEELDFLYLGERKYNIMVANTEYVMNDAAAQWFMASRFLGAGEKVVLAVDLTYSIGDELQEDYRAFEKREPMMLASLIVGGAVLALLIVLLVLSIVTAGRREKEAPVCFQGFDRVPTEIAAGLCLVAVLIWLIFAMELQRHMGGAQYLYIGLNMAVVAVEYWLCLFSLLSLVRRIKGKNLWSNSVCYAVILGCRQVYAAKRRSKGLIIAYIVFFALNIFFLRFFSLFGVIMALVLDMAVLLYLMRDMVGKQTVREGLYQISQGRLDYKINTTAMTGESLEMAEAVNEMGDGLQEAVDSIVKNERLKSELITNVSHDIKTPLTSIINYVDLLKREELQNERAEEYIRILEQKSQRLKQLTEDLIEASKINSGNVELQLMKLNLQQMLQQAYGEFDERLEENRLEMVLSLEREPILILADGRQLWRIFENLLGNIVKYAMPGTKVFLTLGRKEESAKIVFRNTSRQKLELSAEELQERFVRGDLSRNTEGSGLGLSIARSLTELMEGSFQVDLDGADFRVTLLFPIQNRT
ncbi:MAG: HAMP domain-containing sensor histidine kinase [Lachnospiraceae bacterium]|nr:HAMP domain-containing sensor histidine kinase [Lachnospiraceae bacterium]